MTPTGTATLEGKGGDSAVPAGGGWAANTAFLPAGGGWATNTASFPAGGGWATNNAAPGIALFFGMPPACGLVGQRADRLTLELGLV